MPSSRSCVNASFVRSASNNEQQDPSEKTRVYLESQRMGTQYNHSATIVVMGNAFRVPSTQSTECQYNRVCQPSAMKCTVWDSKQKLIFVSGHCIPLVYLAMEHNAQSCNLVSLKSIAIKHGHSSLIGIVLGLNARLRARLPLT